MPASPLSRAARLHPRLATFVEARLGESADIPQERRDTLDRLAEWTRDRLRAQRPSAMTFICTHNSRRSHICEISARAAAEVFGCSEMEMFSGGTEATAFNPRAVAALRRAGFGIDAETEGDNPRYVVRLGPDIEPSRAFSKVFSEAGHPIEGLAAVMTCSDADANCPFVPGTDIRVAVPYEDPKVSDGTAHETEVYDERVAQIAREMLYLFSRVG